MKLFPYGHATHPQWQMAVGLVLAQLRAHMALPDYADAPRLGLVYITDHYAAYADELLQCLRDDLPVVSDWVGTVGVGIAANQVEYFDEPALTVMLCDIDPAHYRVFSGVAPLQSHYADGFVPQTALVHADGNTLDVGELIGELALRTQSAYLFGGLASSRADVMQFALHSHGSTHAEHATGVLRGGLSGVAFDDQVALMSRVTQGCRPMGPVHTVTKAEQHVVLELDGREALHVLTEDLGIDLTQPREAMPKLRQTLAGISSPEHQDAVRRTGEFGEDVLVRHLIGLDTARSGVAVAHEFTPGMQLTFCERHAAAARADLTRICTEIREALEPEEMSVDMAGDLQNDLRDAPHPARRIAGAIYVSCAGRGGPHFGAPSAELHIVRRALGDVPLVGFFAGGEIAHQSLYGYTGVLTVFTTD
jgi:small ligand-binding sensory domain FIST